MRHLLLPAVAASVLLLAACTSDPLGANGPGAAPGAPIPVEGDGGIGGPPGDPDGPVDTTVFIAGERPEVTGLCRDTGPAVDPATVTYVIDLLDGTSGPASLTVEVAGRLAVVTYATGEKELFTTPEGQPAEIASGGEGVIVIQATLVDGDGQERFADLSFGVRTEPPVCVETSD